MKKNRTKAITKKTQKPSRFKDGIEAVNNRRKDFLSRRPHRSFRRTKRRDYNRQLKLPGYWALTVQVWSILRKNKRVFLSLAASYAAIAILFSSFMSQDAYLALKEAISEGADGGALGASAQLGMLFVNAVNAQLTGSSFAQAGSPQQIVVIALSLFAWLATIWLMRNIMSDGKPKMRDGLYSSGGPIIALLILAAVLVVQALPAIAAMIAYSTASQSGVLDYTAIIMLFGGAVILLTTLSAYWAVSTVFAMVIVTLPGMYPFRALRLAGDIVTGRRTRIVLRVAWSIPLITSIWVVVAVPVMLIDNALKSVMPDLSWLPLVPIVLLLLTAGSIVVFASYAYVLYRRIVEDDTAPA